MFRFYLQNEKALPSCQPVKCHWKWDSAFSAARVARPLHLRLVLFAASCVLTTMLSAAKRKIKRLPFIHSNFLYKFYWFIYGIKRFGVNMSVSVIKIKQCMNNFLKANKQVTSTTMDSKCLAISSISSESSESMPSESEEWTSVRDRLLNSSLTV